MKVGIDCRRGEDYDGPSHVLRYGGGEMQGVWEGESNLAWLLPLAADEADGADDSVAQREGAIEVHGCSDAHIDCFLLALAPVGDAQPDVMGIRDVLLVLLGQSDSLNGLNGHHAHWRLIGS